jgi:Fe-S-cluster containining protein
MSATKVTFDCSKCPGYCCTYDRIETKPADIARLAKYHGVSVAEATRRFTKTYTWEGKTERILRHQKDTVYKSICMFFDKEARRCTIYKGRPAVCREYPDGKKCGYYDFIKFERKQQDDPAFIPNAGAIG